MTKLPINLNDLLRQRTVEGERIEYKTGWNPDAIIRTLCAFANDFENLGGGYAVIGQDCDANCLPVFPPVGLAENQLDKIQQELLAACQLIQPPYFPVLSIEEVEGRKLIVLWAPGGQNRPYKAPEAVTANKKTWRYYIRRYSSTVEAKDRAGVVEPGGQGPVRRPLQPGCTGRRSFQTPDAGIFAGGWQHAGRGCA